MRVDWNGVFPAVTTQLHESGAIDPVATQKMVDELVKDGVDGIIALGTVGEGNSLVFDEKLEVLDAIVKIVAGRVPVIAGVSEYDNRRAKKLASACEAAGANGLMVLPPMVYVPQADELVSYFRDIAGAVSLPIMLYNNPPAYRSEINAEILTELVPIRNIVSVKESSPDTRSFTDIHNRFGDRFVMFAGLDDVAFEGLTLGAQGWVSGLTNVFPRESVALVQALGDGDHELALTIYRWFMPLLHLDAGHDLVQCIKLAEQVVGRGRERVLPPRLPLTGERRAEVIGLVEAALATRPVLTSASAVRAA